MTQKVSDDEDRARRDGADTGVPGDRPDAPGGHREAKGRTVGRTSAKVRPFRRARWRRRCATALVGVTLGALVGGATYACLPGEPLPPTSGTVVGFRFSSAYQHRCRLWIKPTGSTLRHRVLVDPNSETECLNAQTGDRWERAR